MLPKKHRLSKHADVVSTTARGRSFFSPSFVIKTLPTAAGEEPKLTVIISVKVSKSSVIRNRLKRVIREAIHGHLDKLKPGKYAIIVKQSATKIPGFQLAEEVKTALVKSKIIR